MQGKLTSSSNMVTTNIYEPIVFTEILSIRDDHYGSLVCVYAQNITDFFSVNIWDTSDWQKFLDMK